VGRLLVDGEWIAGTIVPPCPPGSVVDVEAVVMAAADGAAPQAAPAAASPAAVPPGGAR